MYSFPNLEPVCCSMFNCNCCFLTCIQVSQETGKVVWYSHLLKNFPQFVVIHTVKGFGVVNKADVDVLRELSCFLMIQRMLAIWSLVPLPFLNPAWTCGSSQFMYCWSLTWRILSITLLACEMSAIMRQFEHSLALPFFGMGFPDSSVGKKICLECRRPQFDSWVGKIRWRRDRLPTRVFLGFLCGSAG